MCAYRHTIYCPSIVKFPQSAKINRCKNVHNDKNAIRTHISYIANAKKSCYIKQQFTVLKARAS